MHRVLLADDHSLIVEGMRSILATHFDVVGVASNGRDLVEAAQRLRPDVVLLDISMPELNGIEAARQIKEQLPTTKLVFVTQWADRAYINAAFQVGASGYVLKQGVAAELIAAIRHVLAGYRYISDNLQAGLPQPALDTAKDPGEMFGLHLTGRKREVLQLIAEGKSNKEIANALNISVKTVEFHKAGLMDHLGLRTTAELTRYAIEHGILTVPREQTMGAFAR